MGIIQGISYNLRGLRLALATPKLLFWGVLRFIIVVFFTILGAIFVFAHYQEILNIAWTRPESPWVAWSWHLLSWILSLFLLGISAVVSYLLAQLVFGVIIMDLLSRITEIQVTGRATEASGVTLLKQFSYLIAQEIPRTILPVLISLLIMIAGWLTPLGPLVAGLSSAGAAVFLAWDNTDLVPARRLVPFRKRLTFLLRSLRFHLGFGVLFLIPFLNVLFLSFAPVGATLYWIDRERAEAQEGRKEVISS